MKILLCTTSLGYGGAETHVCGLAEGLTALGHDVTVASSGGELAASLPRSVRHVTLPAFSRRFDAIVRSSAAIKKLLKHGKFDVVHAHARIPALICRKYAKKYGARFVVTAHAHFKMTPALRRLSVWGDRTVAVSEDIKQMLIDTCGVYPGHITVIPNGIDTDRFSPCDTRMSGADRILFVSRMDSDCSLVAHLLCRIAGRLAAEYPGIKITLTGGGSEYERIRAHAEGINAACGSEVVEVTGARNDIDVLMKNSDIFVGVSRAALEAAACGLPVIIAGNEGYSSILSPDNTPTHNNFCGRGDPLPDSERLYADLKKLLDMSDDKRRALGDYGREYVIKHHSANSSAAAVEAVYNKTPLSIRHKSKGKKAGVVICGYYGFGNAGDNAVLDSLLDGLNESCDNISITVMTARPRDCERRFGVRCINRTNIFSLLLALCRSSYFILGGGTLIQNATSPRSLRFYSFVSRLACLLGCKLIIYGSGLGPLYGKRARRIASSLLSHASLVGLRENTAYDLMRSLGGNLRTAAVYADPALLMTPAPPARAEFLIKKYFTYHKSGKPSSRRLNPLPSGAVNSTIDKDKFFAISLREPHKKIKNNKDFEVRLADVIDKICAETQTTPVFFVMSPEDKKINSRVCSRLEHDGIVLPCLAIQDIIGLLSRCHVGLGMRLHMLVFSVAAKLPVAGIGCDPKIGAFLEHAKLPEAIPPDIPRPDELVLLLCRLSKERDYVSARLERRLEELRSLARAEIDSLVGYIEKCENEKRHSSISHNTKGILFKKRSLEDPPKP